MISRREVAPEVKQLEWSDVTRGPLVGVGGFSSVYKVILRYPHARYDDRLVLKCLKTSLNQSDDDEQRSKKRIAALTDLAAEAEMLSGLHHENIIRLRGVKSGCPLQSLETTTTTTRGYFLVLDRLDCTLLSKFPQWQCEHQRLVSEAKDGQSLNSKRRRNLASRLRLSRKVAPEVSMHRLKREIHHVILGIARGLAYLHEQGVVHRDVKPGNIGLDSSGNVRIFDFGLARRVVGTRGLSQSDVDECMCTPRYGAPEVAQGKSCHLYSDVYSFAMILWQLLTLEKPFAQYESVEEFQKYVFVGKERPPLQASIESLALQDLLEQSWHDDPHCRPGMLEVLACLEEKLPDKMRRLQKQ